MLAQLNLPYAAQHEVDKSTAQTLLRLYMLIFVAWTRAGHISMPPMPKLAHCNAADSCPVQMLPLYGEPPAWSLCAGRQLTQPVQQGPFVDCNVRIANLKRIEHSVGTALRKWSMQHDQQMPLFQ